MKTLRLFRGISVPSASVADVTSSILSDGLIEGKGTWTIEHLWRSPPGVSFEIADLIPADVYKADWPSVNQGRRACWPHWSVVESPLGQS